MHSSHDYTGHRTGRFNHRSHVSTMRDYYDSHYHSTSTRETASRHDAEVPLPIRHDDSFEKDLAGGFGTTSITGRRIVTTITYTHRHIQKIYHCLPNKLIDWQIPGEGKQPWKHFPDQSVHIHKYTEKDVVPVPSKIEHLDLCINENSIAHHTDKYEICGEHVDEVTQEEESPQLVIRRGQPFNLKLTLDKEYDAKKDKIIITSEIGRIPLRSKGTKNEMIVGEKAEDGDWEAVLSGSDDRVLSVAIHSPTTCAVGKWTIHIETHTGKGGKRQAKKYLGEPEVYILFNPWCEDDPTYMEDDEWRNEYVLNDSGKVYTGNYKQIFGKPWIFGQFDDVVLKAAIWLLDNRGFMSWTARGNPVYVSRKISALVNSIDDRGVLTGKWDGEYSDGVSPTAWTGSVAILKKYLEHKRPVKYGQCWVFSGVTTSICRALGLPARSVTNFASAHDTDGSLTIDVHWNVDEEPMPELDTDSVWNFHVWNEVWMVRPELPAGYGGWQVIDATPQEASDGVYCAGPASVNAVKSGDVAHIYGTSFVFAEVNADKVHWVKQADGSNIKILQRHVIGKNISTKAIGKSSSFSVRGYCPDREDITSNYKYPEGSTEERASVWRAAQHSTKPSVYKDDDQGDVHFEVEDIDHIFVGEDFDVPIKVTNTSSEDRTVSLSVALSSVYYTGVTRKLLKKEKFSGTLSGNTSKSFKLSVAAEEYLDDMVDNSYAMKINYLGTVKETKQMFANQDDFRLRTLVPDVKTTKPQVKTGEVFKVNVEFKNPLKTDLTSCVFSFEAAGNLKPVKIATSDVPAGGIAQAECEVEAKRKGDCVVIVAFECKQLGDVQGQCTVDVQ